MANAEKAADKRKRERELGYELQCALQDHDALELGLVEGAWNLLHQFKQKKAKIAEEQMRGRKASFRSHDSLRGSTTNTGVGIHHAQPRDRSKRRKRVGAGKRNGKCT